jgi:hypothetical protein
MAGNIRINEFVGDIRQNVLEEQYREALDRISALKQEIPTYEQSDLGYLIDYYHALCLFMEGVKEGFKGKVSTLEKILGLYSESLKFYPEFADTYFMRGYALMTQVALMLEKRDCYADIEICDAMNRAESDFQRAIQYNPGLEEESKRNIEAIRSKKNSLR